MTISSAFQNVNIIHFLMMKIDFSEFLSIKMSKTFVRMLTKLQYLKKMPPSMLN